MFRAFEMRRIIRDKYAVWHENVCGAAYFVEATKFMLHIGHMPISTAFNRYIPRSFPDSFLLIGLS